VRLLRCTAQVLRGVFVKYYDCVATVRLREIFLSTARLRERVALRMHAPPCKVAQLETMAAPAHGEKIV
jgi:hypothetical protein